ncbi:MAG: acetyltransferase [Lachnospiraceae bacterium]
MEKIVLVGSGGCMRELFWQIEECNQRELRFLVTGYVDIMEDLNFESIYPCPYLGDDSYLLRQKKKTSVVICVGDPKKRKELVEKYSVNKNLCYPNIILPMDGIAPDVAYGKGCIISRDVVLSTNVTLGDFVFANLGTTICHDGKIGDYTTLNPQVKLAGTVSIGSECSLGIGSTFIQGITVGEEVIVGAGAVVIGDLPGKVTAVGVPARIIA